MNEAERHEIEAEDRSLATNGAFLVALDALRIVRAARQEQGRKEN